MADAYSCLLPEEELKRFESDGEVPLIRDGKKTYEALNNFTLRDLPAVQDTLVVLEDHRRRERQQAERKTR